MNKREQLIQSIQSAGYKGDQAAFLRLYTENRISFTAARSAYERGARFAAKQPSCTVCGFPTKSDYSDNEDDAPMCARCAGYLQDKS